MGRFTEISIAVLIAAVGSIISLYVFDWYKTRKAQKAIEAEAKAAAERMTASKTDD